MKIVTSLRAGLAVVALLSCLVSPAPALADDPAFPSRPVRIVVGFAPGGSNDIIARLLAPRLAELLGQNVVVENRPGAGGAIAASHVVSSPPDGHTVLMCTTGIFSIQPHLAAMPFNPEVDLQPVTLVANAPYVLMINAGVPVKTVGELVAYAKQNPGKVNFASSGNATAGHLAGEMFNAMAGVQLVHVPYKGTSQAVADLLSGQVQVIFDQPVSTMQYAKTGQLRPLGVAALKRLPAYPDLPTVHESGVPNFDPVSWTGFCAAKNTPAAAIERLQRETAKVLAMPQIAQKLIQDGLDPVGSTPEQFKAFLAADRQKWGRVIRAAGIKGE